MDKGKGFLVLVTASTPGLDYSSVSKVRWFEDKEEAMDYAASVADEANGVCAYKMHAHKWA